MAAALAYAHSHGVVHRDIKPDNIMLSSGQAVVTDFGIARDGGSVEELTQVGTAIGTVAYMSPEQAGGESNVDGRTDIYALGTVLYEMLAGERPYTRRTAQAIITKRVIDPVPSVRRMRETVSSAIDAALTKALAKTPADRFASATDFTKALMATVPHDEARPQGRRVLIGSGVGVVLTVIALIVSWNALSSRAEGGGTSVISEKAWTIVSGVDGTAPEGIRLAGHGLVSAAIDESAVLRTLPANEIQRGLALAGKPDTPVPLQLEEARELAFRGSIRTVVAATIDQVGQTFPVTVRVLDADDGTVIAVARGNANGEDEVVAVLDDVVQRLRRDLRERPRDIQAMRPLRQAATPSLEAYRLFDRGEKLFADADFAGAVRLYQEALQHDPDFAVAMARIGTAYGNLTLSGSARFWNERASELPERLSAFRRLDLESSMAATTGEQLRIRERMVREFGTGYHNYAMSLMSLGRTEEAIAIKDSEPPSPFGFSATGGYTFASWLLAVGRSDDAGRIAEQLTGDLADRLEISIAASRTEWAVAESLAVPFLQKPNVQYEWFYPAVSVTMASSHTARGRFQRAIEALDQGTRFYAQLGHDAGDASTRQARLILRVIAPAGIDVAPLPTLASGGGVGEQRLTAMRAAWAGDTIVVATYLASPDGRQEVAANEINPDHAQRLVLRALLAAVDGRPEDVIELLETVAAPTFARGYSPPFSQLERWTIAEAYEEVDDLESAAAYFALLASYEGFSDTDQNYKGLVYSFANRRVALLYAKLGDIEGAENHWSIFLDNFTDPDPDLQWMVDEGRAELERMGRGG